MNNFFNFCIKMLELLKKDIQVRIALGVLFSGVTLFAGATVTITKDGWNVSFGDANILILFLGSVAFIVGLIMCIVKFKNANKDQMSTLYLGANIQGTTQPEPIKFIPSFERAFCIPKHLKRIDTYNKDEVIKNYEFNKELFDGHYDHSNSKNIYLASLGSFPYLFLLGSLLRNGYRKVFIMDFNRDDDMWYSLKNIGKKKYNILDSSNYEQDETIESVILRLQNDSSLEVGIALSYTFNIEKNNIPLHLKDKTLFLKHSVESGHDLLSDLTSQGSLLKELSQYIEKLSRTKKVCLFVSAQASFCLNLGKRYMDNSHGSLKLYNYNRDEGFNWSIEFNNGNIS